MNRDRDKKDAKEATPYSASLFKGVNEAIKMTLILTALHDREQGQKMGYKKEVLDEIAKIQKPSELTPGGIGELDDKLRKLLGNGYKKDFEAKLSALETPERKIDSSPTKRK